MTVDGKEVYADWFMKEIIVAKGIVGSYDHTTLIERYAMTLLRTNQSILYCISHSKTYRDRNVNHTGVSKEDVGRWPTCIAALGCMEF